MRGSRAQDDGWKTHGRMRAKLLRPDLTWDEFTRRFRRGPNRTSERIRYDQVAEVVGYMSFFGATHAQIAAELRWLPIASGKNRVGALVRHSESLPRRRWRNTARTAERK